MAAVRVAQRHKYNFQSPVHVIALHAYAITFKQDLVEDYGAQLLLGGFEGFAGDGFQPR
jgi:hypothetical protein